MQRVSSLLPLWDRTRSADSASKSGTAASPATATNNRSSSSSSILGGGSILGNSSSSFNSAAHANNSSSSASSHNRNSGNSLPLRNGRPLHRVFSWADRIGANKTLSVSPSIANAAAKAPASGQMGREAYWPTTLDRECEKAARILKSFCTDGFLDDATDPAPTSPISRASITSLTSPRLAQRRSADVPPASPTTALAHMKRKIPPRIIQEAYGLAIFSCMRSGLWMSGSGGSGILIARKADGTWSPPSGILLHTSTVAFVVGVDIYDCVLVINSVAALELFTRSRVVLGTDVPLTVGPLVTMGLLENDVRLNHELGDTVLTYLKARGRHSPAQLHGSLVTERSNENERFYNDDAAPGPGARPVDILDILAGNVRKSIPEILPLFEAIKAAEGRNDFDTAAMDRLSQQPAPGDADIAETPALLSPISPTSTTFGIPDASDPDPFGIIALEMAGLEIREAGSKHRPSSHQFDFNNASPTSPFFPSRLSRQSADTTMETGNRASLLSMRTQATSMTDACTQTDVAGTPDTSLSPTHSDDGKDAQEGVASTVPSPIPELSVQAAPNEHEEDGAPVGIAPVDALPQIPPRSRRMGSPGKEKRASKLLSVDHGMEADDHLSDATATVACAAVAVADDEHSQDADDEDEETDALSDEGDDDVLDDGDEDLGEADDLDDDDDDDEEPVIFEVASTTVRPVRAMPAQGATQVAQVVQVKGSLVNIPKRIPPPLPARSPARTSRASKSEFGDVSLIASPLRQSFQSADATDAPAAPFESFETDAPKSSLEGPAERAAPTEAERPASVDVASPSSGVYESATDQPAVAEQASGDDLQSPPTAEPTASSIDDSDREPQTPRVDDVLKFGDHGRIRNATTGQKQQDLDLNNEHNMNSSPVTLSF